MIDPYLVLGLPPSAPTEEVEARYRLLLREYHPDLHHHRGPEAVAQAEEMTRRINAAMDSIRRGEVPPMRSRATPRGPGEGDRPGAWSGATSAGPAGERPWSPFDEAVEQPVPCPFCGLGLERLSDYDLHMRLVHRRQATPAARPGPGRVVLTLAKLRYVPSWLVLAIGMCLWFAIGFFWFVGAMAFLVPVLWAQSSPRVRTARQWDVLREP